MVAEFIKGVCLTAEFEFKAAGVLKPSGLVRLLAEPIFYSMFVVTALASRGGVVQGDLAVFLGIGVIGIQCVRMMMQTIFRWTLERKWSLGGLKLTSGVLRISYFIGMMVVPIATLILQTGCIVGTVFAVTGFRSTIQVAPLVAGVVVCGAFWASTGCLITAVIKSYKTRDFVVAMLLTPLMFSAPTLYSLEHAPALLTGVSLLNPLTYQLEFLRHAAVGAWDTSAASIVIAMTAVMAIFGYSSTQRMLTVSREG